MHEDRPFAGQICPHLLETKALDYVQRFLGIGRKYDLLCSACCLEASKTEPALVSVCGECFRRIEEDMSWQA
jgi:hypothetical protein